MANQPTLEQGRVGRSPAGSAAKASAALGAPVTSLIVLVAIAIAGGGLGAGLGVLPGTHGLLGSGGARSAGPPGTRLPAGAGSSLGYSLLGSAASGHPLTATARAQAAANDRAQRAALGLGSLSMTGGGVPRSPASSPGGTGGLSTGPLFPGGAGSGSGSGTGAGGGATGPGGAANGTSTGTGGSTTTTGASTSTATSTASSSASSSTTTSTTTSQTPTATSTSTTTSGPSASAGTPPAGG